MIALMVQILAPIGASWAFAAAVTDPLGAAEICHAAPSSTGSDQGSPHHGHDASCVLCCGFNVTPGSSPEPAGFSPPYRFESGIVWRISTPQLADSRTGSNARARAPPSLS